MRTAAIACLALAAACARAPERPNVLLVTIDAWRADRLSAGGYPRAVTPHLDRLAQEGLRFTSVTVPRAKTTPSVATLLTGLYPHEHGARDVLVPLDAAVPTLAERLRAAGYATGAIVGNFVLSDRYSGLARGFDAWTEDLPQEFGVPPENVPQRTARSLVDGALAALGLGPPASDAGPAASFRRPGAPWFLWLHAMDPHGSYDPPPEHDVYAAAAPEWIPPEAARAPNAPHRRWIAEYNVPAEARAADGRIDAARVRARYDGEVRYADRELGRLFDALRAAGELERTLVIVTSDHGESLGEQDYWFEHGRNASEATVRVPLLVRWPESLAGRPAPGVRHVDTSLADIAPTVLDLLELPPLAPPAAGRGASLADDWRADRGGARPVYCEKVDRESLDGAVQAKSVRIGGWKWIRRHAHVTGPDGARRLVTLSDELYDVASDPYETRNLADAPPPRAPVERLLAELARFTALDARFPEIGAILQRNRDALERGDAELLRILEGLGY